MDTRLNAVLLTIVVLLGTSPVGAAMGVSGDVVLYDEATTPDYQFERHVPSCINFVGEPSSWTPTGGAVWGEEGDRLTAVFGAKDKAKYHFWARWQGTLQTQSWALWTWDAASYSFTTPTNAAHDGSTSPVLIKQVNLTATEWYAEVEFTLPNLTDGAHSYTHFGERCERSTSDVFRLTGAEMGRADQNQTAGHVMSLAERDSSCSTRFNVRTCWQQFPVTFLYSHDGAAGGRADVLDRPIYLASAGLGRNLADNNAWRDDNRSTLTWMNTSNVQQRNTCSSAAGESNVYQDIFFIADAAGGDPRTNASNIESRIIDSMFARGLRTSSGSGDYCFHFHTYNHDLTERTFRHTLLGFGGGNSGNGDTTRDWHTTFAPIQAGGIRLYLGHSGSGGAELLYRVAVTDLELTGTSAIALQSTYNGYNTVAADWTPSPGATSYAIWKKVNGSAYAEHEGGLVCCEYNMSVSELAYDSRLTIQVRPDVGAFSNERHHVIDRQNEPPPIRLTGSYDGFDNVTLNWTTYADATDYELWRAIDNGSYSLSTTIGTSGNHVYNASGDPINSYVSFLVEAVGGLGDGHTSNNVSFIINRSEIPRPPFTINSSYDGLDEVRLTWDVYSDASSYDVWVSVNSSPFTKYIDDGRENATYDASDVYTGSTLSFYVVAQGGFSEGTESNTVSHVIDRHNKPPIPVPPVCELEVPVGSGVVDIICALLEVNNSDGIDYSTTQGVMYYCDGILVHQTQAGETTLNGAAALCPEYEVVQYNNNEYSEPVTMTGASFNDYSAPALGTAPHNPLDAGGLGSGNPQGWHEFGNAALVASVGLLIFFVVMRSYGMKKF